MLPVEKGAGPESNTYGIKGTQPYTVTTSAMGATFISCIPAARSCDGSLSTSERSGGSQFSRAAMTRRPCGAASGPLTSRDLIVSPAAVTTRSTSSSDS